MHGRKATGWWRLAAYGSSGGLEESAQGGDLEERVERHVVGICARAGGHCGATRREWAQGLGAGAAALWPCVRVEGVLGSVFEAFAFFDEHCGQAATPSKLDPELRGRKPGRPASVPFQVHHKQRSWLGGRRERRDVDPQAAARQEAPALRRVTCGTPRSAADARNVRLDLGLGRSKCQCVPHRAARSKNGNNKNSENNLRQTPHTAAGARAHVNYSSRIKRTARQTSVNDIIRQRHPTTTSCVPAWASTFGPLSSTRRHLRRPITYRSVL